MRELILKEGFNFAFDPNACAECGSKCCAGQSGDIWASEAEIAAIADFLDEKIEVARGVYFRRDRSGKFSARERQGARGFECVFLGENGCKIYEVRPAQCREFPFWRGMNDRLDALFNECAGAIATGETARNAAQNSAQNKAAA